MNRRTFISGLAASPLAVSAGTTANSARSDQKRLVHAQQQLDSLPLSVSINWLRARLHDGGAGLRLFDVSPLHVFRDEHIDGADHAFWRDTVDPNYPVFGAVLTQGENQRFRQAVIDQLNIDTSDDAVVYDNVGGFRAARLVWFLRFLGFDRAAVLRGGIADWKVGGGSTSSGGSDRASGISSPVRPRPGYYIVTRQLLDRLTDEDLQLIDIRTELERHDDLDGQLQTGMIPGSIHIPWTDLRLDALSADRRTVLYGQFGVDAALPWLALTQAGFRNLEIYDRGWVEWASRSDLEIAQIA